MFHDIISDSVEGFESECQIIESLCFNCHKNGETRIMLTKIKFFDEIMVSSFSCDNCGYSNRSVEPIGKIKDYGQRIELEVKTKKDLDRRAVRPPHSVIDLGEMGQFPSREGAISTIEGLITNIIEKIRASQPERKATSPELAEKLEEFMEKLIQLIKLQKPFKIIIDDPSGNGLIENYIAPKDDPQIKITSYKRSHEQNALLGYAADEKELEVVKEEDEESGEIAPDEVMQFKSDCPNCSKASHVNMKTVNIPHFKDIIIMAIVCDVCGYRNNEVKSGGGIEEKGRRYELTITDESDLKRDVLKSETCGLNIPEIEFEATYGTLESKFTTVEGLLFSFYENLSEKNPFVTGDSASEEMKKLGDAIEKIKKIANGEMMNVRLILDDPAGNSYLQNYYAPDPDPNMQVIDYERSEEQNDFIGITGMNTKDFETIP